MTVSKTTIHIMTATEWLTAFDIILVSKKESQHNDIQHNDGQHNAGQYNGIQ